LPRFWETGEAEEEGSHGLQSQDATELETGRPRTEAYIVYLCLMLRSFNGGCKDQHA